MINVSRTSQIKLSSPPCVGIIGGGQLARMMAQEAKTLGFRVIVLDATPDSPAGQVADLQVQGQLDDIQALTQLVEQCDVTTYDIEHINMEALQTLARAGHRIVPSPDVLATIADKATQKQKLQDCGIAVPRFITIDAPSAEAFAAFGYPLVQKVRRGGYDGRGVVVLANAQSFAQALSGPSMLEPVVDIDKELAVMVARGHDGEMRCYSVVEMVFDERANILDYLIVPARIDADLEAKAQALAMRSIEALDGVGIFGVELFLSKQGELLVNEIAPRPHNSGHYTIEACATSQFEQHIRAVTGLPLGSTELLRPAATINLLGSSSVDAPLHIEALRAALAVDGVSIHLYGKAQIRPFRKMGHITLIDKTIEDVCSKAERVKELLKEVQP